MVAYINKEDSFGWTPICSAVFSVNWKDNTSTVKKLIKSGANVNVKSLASLQPLHFAIMAKRVNIIEYLLNNGFDVNYTCNSGTTALFCAIKESSDLNPNRPDLHEFYVFCKNN